MKRKKMWLMIILAVISLTVLAGLFYVKDKAKPEREKMKPFYEEQEKQKNAPKGDH